MAFEQELERLVVRLVMDSSQYLKELTASEAASISAVNKLTGTFRRNGKFASNYIDTTLGRISTVVKLATEATFRQTSAEQKHAIGLHALNKVYATGAIDLNTYKAVQKELDDVRNKATRNLPKQKQLERQVAEQKKQSVAATKENVRAVDAFVRSIEREVAAVKKRNQVAADSLGKQRQQALMARDRETTRAADAFVRSMEREAIAIKRRNDVAAKSLAAQRQRAYNAEIRDAERIVKSTETALDKYGRKVDRATQHLITGRMSIDRYRQALVHWRTELDNANRKLGITAERLIHLGGHLRGIGYNLSFLVTGPLVGIGKAAVSEFTKFDTAITKTVATIGDVTPGTRKQLEEAAKGVAAISPVAPEEVAQGLLSLSQAGYSAQEAIKALPVVTDLAIAGSMQMGDASRYLTTALSAMGMKTGDVTKDMESMRRVSDLFTQAARLSQGEVEDFAQALTRSAAGALRMVNKDLEEGMAILATYAQRGIKGAEASSALSIVMRDLQKAAINNKDAWENLGARVFDSSGKMRFTADIIADLERALKGMSDEQKRATVMQLGFQDRSLKFILNILGMSNEMRNFDAQMRRASGTTKQMADIIATSAAAQITKLWNQVKTAAQELGQALMPALLKIITAIKDTMQWFTSLNPVVQDTIIVIAAVAAAIGPLLIIAGTFIGAWGVLAKTVGVAKLAFTSATAAIAFLTNGTKLSWAIVNNLGKAMTVLKYAAAGAAIGGIALLAKKLYEATEAFRAFNQEQKKMMRGERQLLEQDARKQGKVLEQAGKMQGPQRGEFLVGAFGMAQKELEGQKMHVKFLEKELGNLQKSWVNTGVNMIYGHAGIQAVTEQMGAAQSRIEQTTAYIEDLKTAMATGGAAPAMPGFDEEDGFAPMFDEEMMALIKEGQEEAEKLIPPLIKIEMQQKALTAAMDAGKITMEQYTNSLSVLSKRAEAQNKGPDFIRDLEREIELFGLSRKEIQARELAEKGATAAQIKQAIALAEKLQGLKDEEKALEESRKIMEKWRSPAEEFFDIQAQLKEYFDAGLISLEAYNHELKEAREGMKKDLKVKVTTQGFDALAAGSAELSEFMTQFRLSGGDGASLMGRPPLPPKPAPVPHGQPKGNRPADRAPPDRRENKQEEYLRMIVENTRRMADKPSIQLVAAGLE